MKVVLEVDWIILSNAIIFEEALATLFLAFFGEKLSRCSFILVFICKILRISCLCLPNSSLVTSLEAMERMAMNDVPLKISTNGAGNK